MISGIGWKEDTVYHEFGRRLAERGYVVFAPLLLHRDPAPLTDEQSRKADAVGMMRIAMPIAKTRRVVEFLRTLPQVDPDQIGYYGLSYGGYSAIWIPPLVESLSLTIISGHFNDWREKITADSLATSYLRHPYEDFYNWDILHRFTHPELIAMIAPRPVCVEFGEQDGITTPQWPARAWRQVSAIRDHLGLANRITLAHFDGPHEIHGIETFDFLDRFLQTGSGTFLNQKIEAKRCQTPSPVGRDYEYALGGGAYNWSSSLPVTCEPFVTGNLDAGEGSRMAGRCWMPAGAKTMSGLAVKLSRVGHPGAIELRLGTESGKDNLGTATMASDTVLPLFEQWYELPTPPKDLPAGATIHWSLSCRSGSAPADYYIAYGPRPIGGRDDPHHFGLSYRLLTDRAVDSLCSPNQEQPFRFVARMLEPYYANPPPMTPRAAPAEAGEAVITRDWTIRFESDPDGVMRTAAGDLQQFLAACTHLQVEIPGRTGAEEGAPRIELGFDRSKAELATDESYRVEVQPQRITISGRMPRGVMRGVYWIEEMMRFRGGPFVKTGTTVRDCRFARRLTSSVVPSDAKYEETSHPLLYNDGLLQHISHQGFNALWVWLNAEETTLDSRVFPELNDPEATVRFARLNDLVRRARPYGIDVYCYYATNYHHPVPPAFYEKHPEARGVGWGNAMCTSNEQVRAYHAENVRTLVQHVPGLKGLVLIFDSEGFFYCGNTEANRQACPRCRKRTCVEIATELIGLLNDAMHAGGPDRKLILWPYGHDSGDPRDWVMHLIPHLPKDIIFQVLFSKGDRIVRDGVEHITGDYNISTVGPQIHFEEQLQAARKAGLTVMAKTEHAISQEFVFVPYIPCMEQWHRRAARMGDYPLGGLFCNWMHYGYTPSPTAEVLMWDSRTEAPPIEKLLSDMATRDYGAAAPHVVSAWSHFTKGIEQFPYSDPVVRIPGPLQKGPSQPLFLDPKVPSFGGWRAWQNDLKWTEPWGPKIAAKYLGRVEREFAAGLAELEKAASLCEPDRRTMIEKEMNIARAIRVSLHTILNLIEWVPVRDAYAQSTAETDKGKLRERLIEIARDELTNARSILPVLETDSRIGYSATGQHAGLFTPALVRIKIGMLEDLLERDLAPMKPGE